MVQIRVVNVTPGRFDQEDWIEVEGTIHPVGRQVIVVANSIEDAPRPDRRYLTP